MLRKVLQFAAVFSLAMAGLVITNGCEGNGGGDKDAAALNDLNGDTPVNPDGQTPADLQEPDICQKQCGDRQCGPDPVCGVSCGTCVGNEVCGNDGQCEPCQPDCSGKQCGSDGCGGSCGTCIEPFEVCTIDQCAPTALELTCAGYFACMDLCAEIPTVVDCPARCQANLAAGNQPAVSAVADCCPEPCDGSCAEDDLGSCCRSCSSQQCAPEYQTCFTGDALCSDLWDCAIACGCIGNEDCSATERLCVADCLAQGAPDQQVGFWTLWQCLEPACRSLQPPADPYSPQCTQQAQLMCSNAFRSCFEHL